MARLQAHSQLAFLPSPVLGASAKPTLSATLDSFGLVTNEAATVASIDSADPNHPTVKPVPYVGVQYAAIPEFQGLGTTVGQQFSAALAGTTTADAALAAAQSSTEREMKRAGYIK